MSELKSNIEWKRWGKDDPLYGVASWTNKQKDGSSPWTNEEFYALGESDWKVFASQWRQYGLNTQSVLEIGCGTGRITRQLAREFDRVQAVDVSEDMIGRAKEATEGRAEFTVIDGMHLPQPDGSLTAIFSTHVLQHLDSADIGQTYFKEFYRVLAPGGTLMVHLPLYQFPLETGVFSGLMRVSYKAYRLISQMGATIKRGMGRKTMRMTAYPEVALISYLQILGFTNVECRMFTVPSNGSLHSFVFATR